MASQKTRYSRPELMEVRNLADRRLNLEMTSLIDDVLKRMGRRQTISRDDLTPEEKDLVDWAFTSPAA